MLKYIIYKILNFFFDLMPLRKPTQRELYLVSELKNTFRSFHESKKNNNSEPEINSTERNFLKNSLDPPSWSDNMDRLNYLVLNKNPRAFLMWDVIQMTMFVSFSLYIRPQLKYLQNKPDWKSRWKKVIRENAVGRPFPYILYPSSSGNLIHCAYGLAFFEEKAKTNFNDIGFIFEFGGGYGSLCRAVFNLRYKGKYVVFDLPPFSALQRYYLKSISLPVLSTNELENSSAGILCISDFDELTEIIALNNTKLHKLFISNWAISETPIDIRNQIAPLLKHFEYFLISFYGEKHQIDEFHGVDNRDYFDKFTEEFKNIAWDIWPIEYIPNNYYLIGSVIKR
jgi:hypothetical protein